MSSTLAYTGAILDGEGCFTITKHLKEKKYVFYQIHINVTNTSKELIDFLHAHFGGSVEIMREIYYVWNLRDMWKLRGFLIDVIPYLLIKRRQAELLLQFVQSRLMNKGRSYTGEEIHLYGEVKRLKREYPDDPCDSQMSQDDNWHYLAGLIDGEGSVRIAKAVHKNEYGNEKLILTPQISIANTDKRLMEFLKKEFEGFIVEKRRDGKWRTLYQWHMQGLKEEFFRQLDGKLIIKQEQLSVILEYISSRKTHYTREAEIDLFLKINKLNKKGKINYSSEDLRRYTLLQRNPRKFFLEKEKLEDLYLNKKFSLRQISRLYNVAFDTVRLRIIKNQIPLRNFREGRRLNPPQLTEEGRKAISEAASKSRKGAWQDLKYRKKMEKNLELARMKKVNYLK